MDGRPRVSEIIPCVKLYDHKYSQKSVLIFPVRHVQRKRLKNGAIPSIFPSRKTLSESAAARERRMSCRVKLVCIVVIFNFD